MKLYHFLDRVKALPQDGGRFCVAWTIQYMEIGTEAGGICPTDIENVI